MNLHIEAEKVIEDLKELASLTTDAKGAQRVAWTPIWDKALLWFRKKVEEEGAEVIIDSAFNWFAKIPGETEEAICIGSHLDSVPNGGWLDGALGVVTGIGIIRRYGIHGKKPKKTIYVVSWADEEGARFGRSCIGSAAVSGFLNIKELLNLKDNEGIEFKTILDLYHLDPDNFIQSFYEFKKKHITQYIELHIEQAPILESEKKSVACVYGVTGCKRQYVIFQGQQSHSGCPISMRHDAFLAAAQAALEVRKIGIINTTDDTYAYCTVGKVDVEPGVVTIFPGKCKISLDQRHINNEILQKIYKENRAACIRSAEDNGVTVSFKNIWSAPPTLFDDQLIALCREAIQEETGEVKMMCSGPLHDAVEMAKIIPTVMMFVPSIKGLSHCKEEDTKEKDLIIGISAFFRLADKIIKQ